MGAAPAINSKLSSNDGKKILLAIQSFGREQITQHSPCVVVTVIEKQSARRRSPLKNPVDQFALIGMGRVIAETSNLGFNFAIVAVNPNLLGTAGDDVPKRSGRLVTDEQNRRSPVARCSFFK